MEPWALVAEGGPFLTFWSCSSGQVLCWLSHNQGPFVNTQRQNGIVAEAQLLVLADPGPNPTPGMFWL